MINIQFSKIINFVSKNSSQACFLLLFIFFIIYFPSLYLPFGWDDFKFLYDAHFSGISTIYKGFISSYISRPLTRELIWVVGELFTYNEPFVYRIVNITLLLLTALTFFKILTKHFKF
ncbi:MAG: hypothetical protein NC935_05045, partial [Candidatus Omnitrophica bacterium]|nr:hypothetical protein [Candidatus Omnitrophota bacterium]